MWPVFIPALILHRPRAGFRLYVDKHLLTIAKVSRSLHIYTSSASLSCFDRTLHWNKKRERGVAILATTAKMFVSLIREHVQCCSTLSPSHVTGWPTVWGMAWKKVITHSLMLRLFPGPIMQLGLDLPMDQFRGDGLETYRYGNTMAVKSILHRMIHSRKELCHGSSHMTLKGQCYQNRDFPVFFKNI